MNSLLPRQQVLEGSYTAHPPALPGFPVVTERTRAAKYKRYHKLIAVLSAFLAAALLVIIVFHGFLAWMIANPYVAPLSSNPKDAIGLNYEDVLFPSASGRSMVSGWFIPAEDNTRTAASSKTIIFSHGYGANREESWVPMYELTKLLHSLHYNVLMFDYGYASQEYKSPATGGYEESQQLLAAVHNMKARGSEHIIVWGFSMGAGTALQTGLLTNDIDAMLLDSLFLPSSEALFDNLNQFIALPKFPSHALIQAILPLWTGTSFQNIPASTVMNNSYPIPLYVMHGTNDAKADYTTAEAIAASQHNPLSRSWIVQGGQHEMLFRMHAREYISRAALFLGQVEQMLEEESST